MLYLHLISGVSQVWFFFNNFANSFTLVISLNMKSYVPDYLKRGQYKHVLSQLPMLFPFRTRCLSKISRLLVRINRMIIGSLQRVPKSDSTDCIATILRFALDCPFSCKSIFVHSTLDLHHQNKMYGNKDTLLNTEKSVIMNFWNCVSIFSTSYLLDGYLCFFSHPITLCFQ